MATTTETVTKTTKSCFDQAWYIPLNAILALNAQSIANPPLDKVNLSQGTSRDDEGNA